jgi:hypothetical protein
VRTIPDYAAAAAAARGPSTTAAALGGTTHTGDPAIGSAGGRRPRGSTEPRNGTGAHYGAPVPFGDGKRCYERTANASFWPAA